MNRELELRHLRVFVAVVEAGAHTRAARALRLSQSTVSETLAALERTLGTTLLRKVGRGLQLTAPGEALLPYARKMLALSGELVTGLARVTSDVSASLVVATVESVSAYVLPSRLAGLRERWPKARLEVITGTCAEIRESVAQGKCDLGLVLETQKAQAAESILAKGRLVLLATPAHPLAGKRAAPEQLRNSEFFLSDAAGDYHRMLRRTFEQAQLPAPRMHALGTVEGVKRAIAASGAALGLLPEHAVAQELREGMLAEVRLTPQLAPLVLRPVLGVGKSSPLIEDLLESLRGSLIGG